MDNFTTDGFDITDIRFDKYGNQCVYYKKWEKQRSRKIQLLSTGRLVKYGGFSKMELLTNRKFLKEVSEVITDIYL